MWYVVENFNGTVNYENRNILALTPEVCYGLEKRGLTYKVLEDFYSEKILTTSKEKYFLEQLQWIEEFDDFLKRYIPVCGRENISLTKANYYYIVFFIDTLVAYSHMFNGFFDKSKPKNIKYICRSPSEPSHFSIYGPPIRGSQIIRDIFLFLCHSRNIPVDMAYNRDLKKRADEERPLKVLLGLKLKNILLKIHLKSLHYYFKYGKYNRIFRRFSYKKMKVLFLHAGVPAMDYVIKECINNIESAFIKDKDEIYSLSAVIQKKYLKLDMDLDKSSTSIKRACHQASVMLTGQNKLFDWINKECETDIKPLVIKYLEDFVENICAENLYEREAISEFLKKERIDFVIARSSSERESIGSLLAATATGAKRVCFQHGSSPLDFKYWHITETALMDIYFATDSEAENYFKKCTNYEYVGRREVFESSHHLNALKRTKIKAQENIIMYVPYRIRYGFRCLNNFQYPITWHYHLQKRIVDFFGSRKDYKLIFKIGTGQEWAEESILRYIKDKKFSNIITENKHFYKCLGMAGRILCDFPSSALYEAAAAGLPVMSLCLDTLPEWPDAVDHFGKSIQRFSTIPDAIDKIRQFIEDDPNNYKAGVPTKKTDFLDDLMRAKLKRRYE